MNTKKKDWYSMDEPQSPETWGGGALGAAADSGAPGRQVLQGRGARRLMSRLSRGVLPTSPAVCQSPAVTR